MSTSGGFGLADGCYPIPPALQLVKRFIVGHSAAGARAQGLEVAALLRGSMRPFGLDGLGGAAKRLLAGERLRSGDTWSVVADHAEVSPVSNPSAKRTKSKT
jgi:hypothetical protein